MDICLQNYLAPTGSSLNQQNIPTLRSNNQPDHKGQTSTQPFAIFQNQHSQTTNKHVKLTLNIIDPLTFDPNVLSTYYISLSSPSDKLLLVEENSALKITEASSNFPQAYFALDCSEITNNILPKNAVSFLMINHFRLGSKNLPSLPDHIVYNILTYSTDKKGIEISPLESKDNNKVSYLRIGVGKEMEMKVGDTYLLGTDLQLEVEEVVTNSIDMHRLYQESQTGAPLMIGLDPYLENSLKYFDINCDNNPFGITFSYIKVRFRLENLIKTCIIIANVRTEFKVGRSDLSDINIPYITVSRNQSLLTYKKDKWYINDCRSLNGTWLKIKEKLKIKETSEIKINYKDNNYILNIDYNI